MNSVTTSIFSGSAFRIHGTLAVSTSASLRCTTTSEERRRNAYSGCQYQVAVGGSTGREPIGVSDLDVTPVEPCHADLYLIRGGLQRILLAF